MREAWVDGGLEGGTPKCIEAWVERKPGLRDT